MEIPKRPNQKPPPESNADSNSRKETQVSFGKSNSLIIRSGQRGDESEVTDSPRSRVSPMLQRHNRNTTNSLKKRQSRATKKPSRGQMHDYSRRTWWKAPPRTAPLHQCVRFWRNYTKRRRTNDRVDDRTRTIFFVCSDSPKSC